MKTRRILVGLHCDRDVERRIETKVVTVSNDDASIIDERGEIENLAG